MKICTKRFAAGGAFCEAGFLVKKETVGSRLGARTDGRAESLKKLMPRENTGRAEKEKQENEETKKGKG